MEVKLENGNKVELELIQDAYATGGSFPAGKDANYNGNWYEANAEDSDGNEYMVRWTDVNWDEEDQGNACDWENPNYVQIL